MLAMIATATASQAAAPVVTVDDEQRATVSGQFDSLKELVEEICRKAEIPLYTYDAEDRTVTAGYEDRPLHEVLRRLLRTDSHILGIRSVDGEARVVSVRVMGENKGVFNPYLPGRGARPDIGEALREARQQVPARPFAVPSDLLNSSFNSDNADDHRKAAEYISSELLGSVGSQQRFIGVDSRAIARTFAPYKRSRSILAKVRDMQTDPAVRIKINQIISELGSMP